MFDSYEYTEPDRFLLHTRYYRRFFCDNHPVQYNQKTMPVPFWRNVEWLKSKLAFDGLRYEDYVKRLRNERFIRKYKDELYDLQSAEDTIRLYNAITGKNEKWITAEEYAKKLKERKIKHERERDCSDMGRD